jgi:hypothetical protein
VSLWGFSNDEYIKALQETKLYFIVKIYLQDKSINFESEGKCTKYRINFKSMYKFYRYMILCSMIEEIRTNVELLKF